MPLAKIVAALSDDVLVTNLNRMQADLDAFAAEGIDPASFDRETSLVAAMRTEWRTRSGERI